MWHPRPPSACIRAPAHRGCAENRVHPRGVPRYREGVTDHDRPAERWRTELRHRLMLARKGRDSSSTSALRSALSAIDNAETPGGPVPSAGAIADSAVGLGSAEVIRRDLADDEIRALIRDEIDERRGAAAQFTATGHAGRAAALAAEASVLEGILGEL